MGRNDNPDGNRYKIFTSGLKYVIDEFHRNEILENYSFKSAQINYYSNLSALIAFLHLLKLA